MIFWETGTKNYGIPPSIPMWSTHTIYYPPLHKYLSKKEVAKLHENIHKHTALWETA